jgi:hypothetical protein
MNEENQSQPPPVEPQQNVLPPVVPPPDQIIPSQRNNLSKKRIIIYASLLAVGLVVVIVFLLIDGFKSNSGSSKISPTPTVTQAPTPTIEQEQTMILKKDQGVAIPNSTIAAILKQSFVADKSCRDCTSGAKIEILTKTGESKVLSYSCGGFSGECINSLDAFGSTIVLVREIDTNTVEIKIKH